MGLLVIAVTAALALTLLALATVALVQLVLLFTVRNTLVAIGGLCVVWFVDSRRRQVAKGFYSCTELPQQADSTPRSRLLVERRRRPRAVKDEDREPKSDASDVLAHLAAQEEEEKCCDDEIAAQPTGALLEAAAQPTTGSSAAMPEEATREADEQDETRLSTTSTTSEADSKSEEVPVAALQSEAPPPASPLGPARLPELRRRKWKHPSRSLPLEPKGEYGRRSANGSASNSPRRPETYKSPRSVAMEQKLMTNALESDGYWIGDFRAPVVSKRSQSMQTKTTTTAKAPPTRATPVASTAHHRTGPRTR